MSDITHVTSRTSRINNNNHMNPNPNQDYQSTYNTVFMSKMLWSHLLDCMWIVLIVIIACVVALYTYKETMSRPEEQIKSRVKLSMQQIGKLLLTSSNEIDTSPLLAYEHVIQGRTILTSLREQFGDVDLERYANISPDQLMTDLDLEQQRICIKLANIAPTIVPLHKYKSLCGYS
jgi:hypothetical protein